jgi:peptidylprolyl isomerase
MKTTTPIYVLAFAALVLPGAAQTVNHPLLGHPTSAKTTAAKPSASTAACSKLPTLSPKIPALPANLPCAKPLYTVKLNPSAVLVDVSPMEPPTLHDDLGLPSADSITLSYIDTKVGTGALVVPHKWYSIKYTGYLPDGTIFDASSKHPDNDPFVFLQGPGPGPQGRRQVIIGWDTGIDGMHIGGKRRLFIPQQLGYGPNGSPSGGIPPKSWLIFDIELVAQSDTDPTPKPATPPPAAQPGAGSGSGAATPAPIKMTAPPAPAPTVAPAAPAPPAPAPPTAAKP